MGVVPNGSRKPRMPKLIRFVLVNSLIGVGIGWLREELGRRGAAPAPAAGVRLILGEIAQAGMDLSFNQGKMDRPWNKGGHRQ